MTFDEVMAEITNGLTGDPEKDLRFLNEKSEEYKDHENGPEILRACGRLIYERMPKNDRNDLDEILRKIESHIASELKNAMEQVSQKKPEKALEILERLLGKNCNHLCPWADYCRYKIHIHHHPIYIKWPNTH